MKTKFILLTLLCTLFAFQGFAQSPKMVFVEEGTQASCGPCAVQNPDFDALLDANEDKVVVLKYQTSWPGFDQMNMDNPDEVQDRVDYYGFEGVPTAFTNGAYIVDDCSTYEGAPACLSQADIDAAYSETAAFDLNISGAYEAGVVTITGDLTATDAVDIPNGDVKLRIALVERTIQYADVPGGTNGETEFHHILKKFVTGSAGTDLSDVWEAGDSYTINETLDLADIPIYNYSELQIVAFVQDDNDKVVYQAAKDADVEITVEFSTNATAFNVGGLPEGVCAGEQMISPVFTLQNGGNSMLTTVDIIYSVNGGSSETYAWTGALGTLEREDITLPTYVFTAGTENTLNISIENPNGVADEDANDNDYVAIVPLAPITDQSIIILEIVPDSYGAETTWELSTSTGNVIRSGGPYTTGNTDPIVIHMLMPQDDCYDFEIFDAEGDGICCIYGEGSYTLSDGNGNTLLQGGEFGSSETKPMIVSGGTTVTNNAVITTYAGSTDAFCDETTVAPALTIQNLGVNEITLIDIETRNLGSVIATESWTGSIAAGVEKTIQLADVTLTNSADLSFHIISVNGGEDIYIEGNTYEGVVFPIATSGYGELTMALNTDCWPQETTWAVTDEAGDVVVSGGPYDGQTETAIIETFSLISGCYEFTYFDTYGDGLQGSQWDTCDTDGDITLFDAAGTVLFEYDGMQGTFVESDLFDYSFEVGVEETIFEEGFTVNPNPTSGNLTLDFALETGADATISVHNMLGAQVMTLNLGTLTSGSHIQNIEMNDLASGAYIIRLNAAGSSIAKKVVLTK